MPPFGDLVFFADKYTSKHLVLSNGTGSQHVVAVGFFNRSRVQSLGLMKVNKRKAALNL